jgi:hypothetical protein
MPRVTVCSLTPEIAGRSGKPAGASGESEVATICSISFVERDQAINSKVAHLERLDDKKNGVKPDGSPRSGSQL